MSFAVTASRSNEGTMKAPKDAMAEAKKLLRDEIPKAKASIGYENEHTLNLLTVYAKTLYMDKGNISELMEASMVLEDAEKVARRVLGPAHPLTVEMGNDMKRVGERMDELAKLAIRTKCKFFY